MPLALQFDVFKPLGFTDKFAVVGVGVGEGVGDGVGVACVGDGVGVTWEQVQLAVAWFALELEKVKVSFWQGMLLMVTVTGEPFKVPFDGEKETPRLSLALQFTDTD